jgi:hypothetical protein
VAVRVDVLPERVSRSLAVVRGVQRAQDAPSPAAAQGGLRQEGERGVPLVEEVRVEPPARAWLSWRLLFRQVSARAHEAARRR